MSKTRNKIIVAETPEELEEQLRRLSPHAPHTPAAELPGRKSAPNPDDDPGDGPTQDPDPKWSDPDPEEIDSPPDPPTDPVADPPPSPVAGPATPGMRRYESRIHIAEAWKYTGSLANRPDFVDPVWASWADYDERTKREAGPALRVPTDGPYPEKICRKGDYIVKQLVTMDHSIPAFAQLDVWTEEEFERMFIPSGKNP